MDGLTETDIKNKWIKYLTTITTTYYHCFPEKTLRGHPAAVFVDLSKEFDLVRPQRWGSGRKLCHGWQITSLRTPRSCATSSFLPLSCGVPPGTKVGPLCFLVLVNTLHDTLHNGNALTILHLQQPQSAVSALNSIHSKPPSTASSPGSPQPRHC